MSQAELVEAFSPLVQGLGHLGSYDSSHPIPRVLYAIAEHVVVLTLYVQARVGEQVVVEEVRVYDAREVLGVELVEAGQVA